MKTIKVRSRAVFTVEAPSQLAMLEVPAGMTLDEYREQEEARLKLLYDKVKVAVIELDPELREMLRIADQEAAYWETKRQLVRLKLREAMEFAKKGTVDGVPFVDRRIYDVREHEVHGHTVDALYKV
jgi:hypothetical protein